MSPNRARTRIDAKAAMRRALVGCAARRFKAEGYEATSLRAVARECGVTTGAIFNIFPAKAAVLAAVLADHSPDPATRGVLALRLHGHAAEAAAVAALLKTRSARS